MGNDGSPQRGAQKPSSLLNEREHTSARVRFYEFDGFRIDTQRQRLTRDGKSVPIKPKALETLVLLVQCAGQLVAKEELMSRLWPDTAVEEANLTQNIFVVRKALGDAAGGQHYIVTVARQGYRFVGDVREAEEPARSPHDLEAVRGRPPAPGRWLHGRRVLYAGAAAAVTVLMLAGLGLYTTWRGMSVVREVSPARTLTRLTFGSGLQTDVSWSPDGRRIAYAWDRDGNFDIWVQSVDGGAPTRVTTSQADETEPAWSPDGERLAFRSEDQGGGLFTVNVRGGPVRRIAEWGHHPAWMPNGRDVMFDDWSYPYIVDADGDIPPRAILRDALPSGGWFRWAMHPDGRFSALGPHPTRGIRLFIADRENTRLDAVDAPLDLSPSWLSLLAIHWNRSGTALFVEAMSDGVPTIWRVPMVDPVSFRWRTPERLTMGTASASGGAVSPDGQRLAFTSARAPVAVSVRCRWRSAERRRSPLDGG